MNLTPEQQAILDRPPTGLIKVAAGAGCGKTSTLVEYGRRWPGRGLYLAFNRSIAQEARRKFPPSIKVGTAHSFALNALDLRDRPNVVDNLKIEHLRDYQDMIVNVPGMPDNQVRAAILATIGNFMIDSGSKIKPSHCPLHDVPKRYAVRQMTQRIVKKMLKFEKNGHDLTISHDIYLKTFEIWHRIDGFDYLMLDEAQDLNPVLISIATKAKLPMIVVGDTYQSIYRFRGAVNAMRQFEAEELPLSQSWRFGQEVAKLANKILSYHSEPPSHRLRGNPSRETGVFRYTRVGTTLGPGTTILARTNARLFEGLSTLNYTFHLVGGLKDLNRQLLSAYDLERGKPRLDAGPSVSRFTTWKELDEAADQGDAEAWRLRNIVKKYGDELPDILTRIGNLHRTNEADAQIVVSTAHKAKGREFETVIVLDDFELPSDLAKRRQQNPKSAVEVDQMINLLYVACTRATHRLFLASKLYEELC